MATKKILIDLDLKGKIDATGTVLGSNLSGTNTGDQTSGDFNHDNLTGFVANEHINWTTDQGSTNIHSGNYTDTDTTYSVGDGGLSEINFTSADHTKLNGIASGAEVNVQSDWNATSGDALILNKPTIPQGDITNVIAGEGLTGGGASGSVTLNVGTSGNSGIDVNANNISVDSTVVRTSGNQTIGGIKEFDTHIAMEGSHLVNYRFEMIENASPQYILLCKNSGGQDVNGVIKMDRTSGNYQASSVEVIVSSGSVSMFGGAIRTLQVLQSSEDYRLISCTYNSTEWIAIKYTGNTYPETSGAFFTGRITQSSGFLTAVSSGVTNETAFGGNSESYNEVDSFVVSGTMSASGGDSTDWNTAYTHSQAAHAPTNAEANVQSNWNATSGDAHILNKPTIPSGNSVIDWTADQGATNIHSGNYTDTNTQRAIHDTPANGATTTSISSNWAFDNVKTAVPTGAVFTDTQNTYTSSDFTHDSLTGFVANEHLDWTTDRGATNIHSGNYINTGDTTYVSSDFNHDDLTGFVSTEHINWTTDQGSMNIHSGNYTDTNTHRAVSSTPTNGASTTSISSDWAFDNVKTAVPTGALFTDTNTQNTYVSSDFTHDNLTGFVANEHLDWTADRGSTNIHSGNYTDTNTQLSEAQITAMGFIQTQSDTQDLSIVGHTISLTNGGSVTVPDNDTTYVSSDFTHDSLTGFVANEHINWTADQGSTNIHANNYTDTDTQRTDAEIDARIALNPEGFIDSYTNTTYTAGNGLSLSGTEFRMAGGAIGGSVNLNTYTNSGYYVQGSNNNATSGTNYPANAAGILTVVRAEGNTTHITQTYDQYNSNAFYNRSYYSGTWSTWRNLAQDSNTTYVSSDFTHDSLTGFVANEHLDWTADRGATNIHANNYTDTNTHRAISSTPTNGATSTSISSDWAFDNVKTAVPSGALFTDTDTQNTYVSSDFTHDDLTGFVANEHINWTTDQGSTNIHANNYTDTNTFRAISSTPANGASTTSISSDWAFDNVKTAVPTGALFTDTNTQNTYVSSDFTHDDLTGFVSNEHINWTTDQGATNIHANNYTNTTYTHPSYDGDDISLDTGVLGFAEVISDLNIAVTTDTSGHVSVAEASYSKRTMTLAHLGYTGATNANYITNNNQLTNGAGYTTFTANQSLNTNSNPTFNDIYVADQILHSGDTNTYMRFPSNDTISWTTSGSERMRINSSGNVGIGTTGPTSGIHVSTSQSSARFVSSQGSGLEVQGGGNSQPIASFKNTSASEKVRISSTGNVGIGTTSPSTTLDVLGNYRQINPAAGAAGGTVIARTLTYSTSPYGLVTRGYSNGLFTIQCERESNAGQTFNMALQQTGGNLGVGTVSPSYKLDVSGTGRFTSTVTASNFILSSDERLKTKVKPLTPNKIDVAWKSFEMKDDEGEYRTGVIAQELEENHPEFVNTDDEGYKSVKYIDLLIAKVSELEARLEKLEGNGCKKCK